MQANILNSLNMALYQVRFYFLDMLYYACGRGATSGSKKRGRELKIS